MAGRKRLRRRVGLHRPRVAAGSAVGLLGVVGEQGGHWPERSTGSRLAGLVGLPERRPDGQMSLPARPGSSASLRSPASAASGAEQKRAGQRKARGMPARRLGSSSTAMSAATTRRMRSTSKTMATGRTSEHRVQSIDRAASCSAPITARSSRRCAARLGAVEDGEGQQRAEDDVDAGQQHEQAAPARQFAKRAGIPDDEDQDRGERRNRQRQPQVDSRRRQAVAPGRLRIVARASGERLQSWSSFSASAAFAGRELASSEPARAAAGCGVDATLVADGRISQSIGSPTSRWRTRRRLCRNAAVHD